MSPKQQRPRKFEHKKWLAATLLAALCHTSVVDAAGLGRLNVQSRLGQPFAADIDLINVSADELSTLRVNLAPPAAYQAANLRFDPALNAMRLSVARRANGTPYIRAVSPRSVTEPYLDVLVELTSQEGKLQRAYAVLLDLPETAPPSLLATRETRDTPTAAAPSIAAAPASKLDVEPPRVSSTARTRTRAAAVEPALAAAPKVVTPAPVPMSPVTRPPVTTAAAEAIKVEPPTPNKAELSKVNKVEIEPPKTEPPKPEPKVAERAPPAPEAPQPPQSPQSPQSPLPVAKKAAVKKPPPAAERGFIDTVKPYLAPVGGVALALLAGITGLWAWGLKSPRGTPAPDNSREIIESMGGREPPAVLERSVAPSKIAAANAPAAHAVATYAAPVVPEPTVANVTDSVDAIEEAKVYLEYGQHEPAEKILREALNKTPGREDVQIMLLEILSARGDKDGFHQLARRLHRQTGGLGAHWKDAMAMGYALDPTYPLYLPADGAAQRARSPEPEPAIDKLNNTTDFLLQRDDTSLDMEKTMVLTSAGVARTAPAAAPAPDINFELAPAAKEVAPLDFEIDFSSVKPALLDVPAAGPAIPAIPLIPEIPATPATPDSAAIEDTRRDDVQQKIDLARAYREMGDKEGALELLHELADEGNAVQQAETTELLKSLT
jgi:FimV-like protein